MPPCAELQDLVATAGVARTRARRDRSTRTRSSARATTSRWPCARRRRPRTRPASRSPACTRRSPTCGASTPCWPVSSTAGRSLFRARVVSYRRSQGTRRGAGDRRGRPADGRRPSAPGVMFTADPDDGRPRPRRHRGRPRPGRGRRRRRRSSPTPTSSPRTAPASSRPTSGTRPRSCVPTADGDDQLRRGWPTPATAAGARPTPRCSSWPAWRCVAEGHYGEPQDMEWAIADGAIAVVQSRPITTLGSPVRRSLGGPARCRSRWSRASAPRRAWSPGPCGS